MNECDAAVRLVMAMLSTLSSRKVEFMRACVECLVERLLLNVLKVKEGHAFSEFRRIVI
ncbi:MAG: hypothetical protein USCGTAYLOR_02754 [Chromatiales bacterium USCg_Taylor]|nr:MAG: hypothetical protein USCGTAYLOR_02754 [Chromatiales bacterium USCg_Taylor]